MINDAVEILLVMTMAGVILHSDQGHQFCSHTYQQLTEPAHVVPSMSRRGNCWDNAPIENFSSHLKEAGKRAACS